MYVDWDNPSNLLLADVIYIQYKKDDYRIVSPFVDAKLFSIINEAIHFDYLIKLHVPTP